MALLETLIATQTLAPPKLLLYGPPGAGKTTFAASAGAVLVDCENGAGTVPRLRRTPYLESWRQMREWLVELATATATNIRVVAVDTLDWMIHRITVRSVAGEPFERILDYELGEKPEAVPAQETRDYDEADIPF